MDKVHCGPVRVKFIHPVVGNTNRYKWSLPVYVYDTALEDIMMSHVSAPHITGGGTRVQHTLAGVLRDEISVAHHGFTEALH